MQLCSPPATTFARDVVGEGFEVGGVPAIGGVLVIGALGVVSLTKRGGVRADVERAGPAGGAIALTEALGEAVESGAS
jgi:hypothetical protein